MGAVHVDRPIGEEDCRDEYEKATLSSEGRNALPDRAFAAVWTDSSGKKQRKLPYRHADGSVDRGHLTAALGRLNQTEGMPAEVKARARRKLEAAGHIDKDDGSSSGAAGARYGNRGAGYGHLGARHGHMGAAHGPKGAEHGQLGARHGPKGAKHGDKGAEHGRLGARYGHLGASHGSRKDRKDQKEESSSMTKTLLQKMLGLFKETDVAKRDETLNLLNKELDDVDKARQHDPDDPECDCPECEEEKRMPPQLAAALADKEKRFDKRMVDMQKQLDDANKRAEEASKVAKAERDARADRDMVDVLKSFKATPFNLDTTNDDNDIRKFRKMQDADPDGFKRTMEILKATDAQLAASASFTNIGKSGGGSVGDAWSQIEAKAAELITKSAVPLTKEQAIDKVMDQNPRLVREYRQQQQ